MSHNITKALAIESFIKQIDGGNYDAIIAYHNNMYRCYRNYSPDLNIVYSWAMYTYSSDNLDYETLDRRIE